ncbi:MAG: hypothetical protein P4M11_07500 [Candidatus Pacebacteria bacterium]|nr:hypothetical protein [Candidatus Paceibacterota bacterium]
MPPDANEPGQNNVDESALERLRSRLYKPGVTMDIKPPTLSQRYPSTMPAPAPPAQWTPPPPPPPPKKGLSFAVWFLIGAAAFFLIALGVTAVFFVLGTRAVSNSNMTITIQGPASIASGTAVPLVITVTNHNPAAINNTDITLNFPDGTRSADDVTQPLVRYTNTLGTIAAGGSVTRTVQAVLFGSANQSVTIPVTLEYHTANSDALFTKQQNYTFTITSAPLVITAKTVSSVATGQSLAIVVGVRSNATSPLNNIAVAATYPTGFIPSATNATSTSFFSVGTLQPGQEKDFTIQGTMSGTDNTQSSFGFTVGIAASDGTPTISVPYASQQAQITITKPFIASTISINNSSSNPVVVSAGQSISGIISWVNTVTSAVTNGVVSIQFSGNAFDSKSVTTPDGYYDSSTKTLSFTGQTVPSLASLNAGDTGTGSFTLGTLTGKALNGAQMPTIQLAVSVSGQHTNNGTSETIHNTLIQNIELSTDLALTSSVVYNAGPFTNSGPLPPVVNQPTTYTILWNVSNDLNTVGGGTVTAILPTYVTFTGKVSPNDGSLSYDAPTHTVTWKIGSIPAGATGSSALQAAFQVSLTPSASQSQTSPVLVGNQTLTGTDRFTNTQVGNTANALDIEMPSDPSYQQTFGTVGN